MANADQSLHLKTMALMFAVRFMLAITDINYDYPDEYWQGPEISHKMARGYGFETWEWTIADPIRTPVYQGYLSIGYLTCINLSCPLSVMQLSPRLMQLIVALVCDCFVIKLIQHYFGRARPWMLLLVLGNWFYLASMSRMLINSFETCLTVLSFWLWVNRRHQGYDIASRIVVGVAYIGRPTSIIPWMIIWPYELMTKREGHLYFICKNALQIIAMLIGSFAIGSYYYGKFTLTEINFIKYNIVEKWSLLFGSNTFWFYFVFGLPFCLGFYLFPFLMALVKSLIQTQRNKQNPIVPILLSPFSELSVLIVFIMLLLSCSVHKQQRFLLVLVPFMLILSLRGLNRNGVVTNKTIYFVATALNIVMFLSLNLYGKTSSLTMLRTIREQISTTKQSISTTKQKQDCDQPTIMYLTDPHALPAYSIFLHNVTLLLPDESPMAKLKNKSGAKLLAEDPLQLYNKLMLLQTHRPDYIVLQEKYAFSDGRLRPEYSFLLASYALRSVNRNANIWQQLYAGVDGFVLLAKVS